MIILLVVVRCKFSLALKDDFLVRPHRGSFVAWLTWASLSEREHSRLEIRNPWLFIEPISKA